MKQVNNPLGNIRASKRDKKRKLRVTVFPAQGGQPYIKDVEVDSQGLFTLKDEGGSYQVSRHSVWEEAGIHRAIVNAGNPLTINPYNLVGDDTVHPIALHGVAKNNLWVQLGALANRRSFWRQGSTWGFILIGIVGLLLMLWMTRTIGGGFEELAEAMRQIQIAAGEAASSMPTPASEAGHQNIAPGG